jgi:hypothetical protein
MALHCLEKSYLPNNVMFCIFQKLKNADYRGVW